ncbi:MAG: uncharacterized protein QOE90_1344 [Thermoplasmata archaeon]|nr:uncharacterized protein [Thermoplasmata archaeon]
MALEDELKAQASILRGHALGLMLYGSHASGRAHARSDVDLCVVAGPGRSVEDALSLARSHLDVPGLVLDLHAFEDLPLYLQGAVIDADRIVWSLDDVALYAYLRPFRRRWDDQKHRTRVAADDVRRALAKP